MISIHAPRTGSDGIKCVVCSQQDEFQSTLPARGATGASASAATDWAFQSTLPARGATYHLARMAGVKFISIHAPRTGSDKRARAGGASGAHFNPRSPHGERQMHRRQKWISNQFQSTLPARGATFSEEEAAAYIMISIHAPRTGSDDAKEEGRQDRRNFNPRSPHGERRDNAQIVPFVQQFQSTLPARGATGIVTFLRTEVRHFNPRSPHGERPTNCNLIAT